LRLLLIRHAQTEWNATGRLQGQSDPSLSDLGEHQCGLLQARMRGAQLDALFTSDLERARRTAGAVAAGAHVTVTPDPGLREVGLGEWEGIDRAALERDYPELHRRWVAEPSWDIVPGGEGNDAFRTRVLGALERIVARMADDTTVAAVTHIGVIRLVLSMAAGLESLGLRWPWAVDNTAITTLTGPPDVSRWNTPALVVLAVNDASHLRSEPAA
jgi:broad specificity phosphatase PhoE